MEKLPNFVLHDVRSDVMARILMSYQCVNSTLVSKWYEQTGLEGHYNYSHVS